LRAGRDVFPFYRKPQPKGNDMNRSIICTPRSAAFTLVGFWETGQIDEAMKAISLDAPAPDWDQLLAGESNSIH
jgi:hypothetical protein